MCVWVGGWVGGAGDRGQGRAWEAVHQQNGEGEGDAFLHWKGCAALRSVTSLRWTPARPSTPSTPPHPPTPPHPTPSAGSENTSRIKYRIPTRGLLGLRNAMLTATKGTAVLNTIICGYEEWAGEINTREQGSLVCHETGQVTAYAVEAVQQRGRMFIKPGEAVYEDQVGGWVWGVGGGWGGWEWERRWTRTRWVCEWGLGCVVREGGETIVVGGLWLRGGCVCCAFHSCVRHKKGTPTALQPFFILLSSLQQLWSHTHTRRQAHAHAHTHTHAHRSSASTSAPAT